MISYEKETYSKHDDLFDMCLQLAYIDPLITWIDIHGSHKTDKLKDIMY